MRTTLNLPEKLIREARRLSGAKTKTQAIILGLEELARRKKLDRLWAMRGKVALKLDLAKARGR